MKEVGIDISGNETQSVGDLWTGGESFNRAITVCDEVNAERCPVLPGSGHRHHWGFPDSSALQEVKKSVFLESAGFVTRFWLAYGNGVRNTVEP
jgi:hypothetical protein